MTPGSKELDGYVSPLAGRYASARMQSIWSARRKFETWRRIWLAVAEAQHEMGLSVTAEQVAELRGNLDVTEADLELAAKYERELRHDVMAHVHAWGDRCPTARGIIHLGMTSQDINDNCELELIDEAAHLILERSQRLLLAMVTAAERWKDVPTLGLTHYQPAQPTTVGRRLAMWANEFGLASEFAGPGVLRGLRGATGTCASFLRLFGGSAERVLEFESRVITRMLSDASTREQWAATLIESRSGEEALSRFTLGPTGQTYPRVVDAQVVSALSLSAAALHKCAVDIRLLSNKRELEEPFGSSQVGSSAMPYKRNPMKCERVCALCRFVMNLVGNTLETAATQWLERTLDDSANRRLVLAEAFLALDGALVLMEEVIGGLVVNEKVVEKNLLAELPFLITEAAMMEAVTLGRDRQEVHEAIRGHSMEAVRRIKEEGADNDLLDRLRKEPLLDGVDLDALMDPSRHVGLAVEQTERFVADHLPGLRERIGEHEAEEEGRGV